MVESENVPGAFLIDDPKVFLARNSKIPFLTGINENEGGMMAVCEYLLYSSWQYVQT